MTKKSTNSRGKVRFRLTHGVYDIKVNDDSKKTDYRGRTIEGIEVSDERADVELGLEKVVDVFKQLCVSYIPKEATSKHPVVK